MLAAMTHSSRVLNLDIEAEAFFKSKRLRCIMAEGRYLMIKNISFKRIYVMHRWESEY